jgi:hypothetical protein
VLSTLAGVLPQLPSLKHFGLYNLQLQAQMMPALGHVLLDLPPSVTALTITFAAGERNLSPLQRGMLFNAIALVRGLRELYMPDWDAVVLNDVACMEPLYRLPHLQAMYVPEEDESGAYLLKVWDPTHAAIYGYDE